MEMIVLYLGLNSHQLLKPEMIFKSFISYIIIVFVNFPIFILSSFYYLFSKFDFISTVQLLITAFLLYKLKYNLKFPVYKFDNKFNIFLFLYNYFFINFYS